MGEMDEVVQEFLVESYEGLDQLDADLVALEADPTPGPRIANIFRAVHTIKGTCGILGFPRLEAITHVGENLLSLLRDRTLVPTPAITTALLTMADAVRGILAQIEASGVEGDSDHGALVATLSRLSAGDANLPVSSTSKVTPPSPSPVAAEPLAAAASPLDAIEVLDGRATTVTEAAIRVQVGLLDKLMNLVGELVLARNQILQFTAASTDTSLGGATQRLNLLTSELQEGIMKTRMQPIGSIWNKLPRVVRDLAQACGKMVTLEMEGNDTDLDRSIIEAIKDPLTHIVRNSIDHGIEKPSDRLARGKRDSGTLRLRAFHEGGKVNIEIADDGGGIDPARVRAKAIQRGLLQLERAAKMTDRELINLIFLPGFSTAEAISNVSGRGVGMDVVRTNIERIGGTVDLQSVPGEGTKLRIKIPLTLAIIPALIVTAGDDRYAIPQVSLVELVRLGGSESRGGIETIQGAPLLRLRGNLLPLVYLDKLLGAGTSAAQAGEDINVVVLQADDRQFGLVVDSINDTEEIVVKPLGKELKRLSVFAGATIMGDGKVALILDVLGIGQSANVITEARDRALKGVEDAALAALNDRQTLLLFRAGGRRMAIPIGSVGRLEEFPRSSVEIVGDDEVVQYRGDILPLVRLTDITGGDASGVSHDAPLQVVVYEAHGSRVGLVVGEILDIVNEAIGPKKERQGGGFASAVVVQGKVTELLDVGRALASVHSSVFGSFGHAGVEA